MSLTAVLDASVVLKWFHHEGESQLAEALALRTRFEDGDLQVIVPGLLRSEIVNVAARSWTLGERELVAIAHALGRLGFETFEPEIEGVARWAARGLTAYDAAYVATAVAVEAPLITADARILELAPAVAVELAAAARDDEGTRLRPSDDG